MKSLNVRPMRRESSSGFTLIEVLVSLVVFSLGMLGVAFYSTRSVNLSADNVVHRSALQSARQFVEPLHEALRMDRARLRAHLEKLGVGADHRHKPLFSSDDSAARDFDLALVSAMDDIGQSLMTTDVARWQPPLHLRVDVHVSGGLTFSTTHVLVPL